MSDIADYILLDEFRTTGGGRCQWAFARRGDTDYFIKRFLAPKQVVPGSPGGPATIRARQARCEAFERRQNRLLTALAGKSGRGGNLIAPIDFFSFDGSYYKVTEKIDNMGLGTDKIVGLPYLNQQMIIRSAANSVRILHDSKIVHGDLKADNIIIRTRTGGTTTASIIDFDDSYFQGEPPRAPEEFTFDPSYGAPEVYRFIADPSEANAAQLQAPADVYSLGVVFCEYLTGRKPAILGGGSRYSGEVLLHGGAVEVPPLGAWEGFRPTLESMLNRDMGKRPTLKQVLDGLKATSTTAAGPGTPAAPIKLKGALAGKAAPTSTPIESPKPERAEPAPPGGIKLRGSLAGRTPPPSRPAEDMPAPPPPAPAGGIKLRGVLAPKDSD